MSLSVEELGENQSNTAEELGERQSNTAEDSLGFMSEIVTAHILSHKDQVQAITPILPVTGFSRIILSETPTGVLSDHPKTSKISSKTNAKKIYQTRIPSNDSKLIRSNQVYTSVEELGQSQYNTGEVANTGEDVCTVDSLAFKPERLNTPFLSRKGRVHVSTPVLPIAGFSRTLLSTPPTRFFSRSLSERPLNIKNSSKKCINEIHQIRTASTAQLFFSRPKTIPKIDSCTSEDIIKNSIIHPRYEHHPNSNSRLSLNISETTSKTNTDKCVRVIDDSFDTDGSFWDSVDFNQLDGINDNEGPTCEDIIDDMGKSQIILDKQPTYIETNRQKYEHTPDISSILIGLNPLFWTLAKFTIKNILHLREENSKFYVRNHPVKLVEIIGIVTSLTIKDKFVKFIIEDTTGRIECIKWKNANERSLPSDINDIEVCSLVRLKGKLAVFRGQREITVYDVYILKDFNILTIHLLECEAALKNIYSVDFVLPDCSTIVKEFREKIKKAVHNNIIEKGEAQNIEEYLQIGGLKYWLEFLSVITNHTKLNVLSEIVDDIQPGKSLNEERKTRDKIGVEIIDILSRNHSISLKNLRKIVPDVIMRARNDQIDLVLNNLLMNGDIYEVDIDVYKKT